MRLFFAAFPDRETRRLIASAAASLMPGNDARLVPCENYHITLAFVGEVSNSQAALLRIIVPLEVPGLGEHPFTVRIRTGPEYASYAEVPVIGSVPVLG